MQILSQRDPRWASKFLGKSKSTVGRYGCTITSISMLLDYFKKYKNPGFLADNLVFTKEGLIIWGSLPTVGFQLEKRFYGNDTTLIDAALKHPNKGVIIQVENYHWVLGLGKSIFGGYRIADPWFGDISTTRRYKSITGGAVIKNI